MAGNGQPYCAVHHVIPLAEGGEDRINNAACLCPAHHREVHQGNQRSGLEVSSSPCFPSERGRPFKIYVPFTIRALAVAECSSISHVPGAVCPFHSVQALFYAAVVIGPLGNPMTADQPG